MVFLKIILLALTLSITAGQAPVKLVPKTAPAKPVQLKPISRPAAAKPQPGKSALITPVTSAKTSQTQPQIPQPAATPAKTPLLKPRTAPAPAQKQTAPPQAVVPPAKPKEPFDLKKVIAERKAISKAKALPVVKSDYYTPENLQKLKSQGIPYHLPGILLLDQDNVECPTCGDNLALTLKFAASLLESKQMIICSASLVHNLFYRIEYPATPHETEELKATKFDFSQWQIYDVLNSQFLLFIPNKLKNFFNEELWINNSTKLLNVTDKALDNNWLINKKNSSPKFSADNLKNIFISKKSRANNIIPIWDFIIIGHGSYTLKMVGGLHQNDINQLLSFFDNEINTGVIALESCYSGGKNLELLQVSQSGIKLSHNYILIVCSSTDQVTYQFSYLAEFLNLHNQYYTNAALLADKGESLNNIIKDLQFIWFATGSPHGDTSRIPQVWLPNGLGFQTLNINNDILPLGKVLVKTHEDEKRPIMIKGKRAVLIYTHSIQTPLIIQPTYLKPFSSFPTAGLSFLWTAKSKRWQKIRVLTDDDFWAGLSSAQLDEIAEKLKNVVPPSIFDPRYASGDAFVFPQFLFMGGITNAYFKGIEIKKDVESHHSSCDLCGVFRFIRDSFFAEEDNPVDKNISIDFLTGYNDIALILKAREIKDEVLGINTTQIADLMRNFNQDITLKNIFIFLYSGNLICKFELYNKAWIFEAKPNGWSIAPYDEIEIYRKNYENFKKDTFSNERIDQKSISEILKQKQLKILKTKAAPKNAKLPRKQKTIVAANRH